MPSSEPSPELARTSRTGIVGTLVFYVKQSWPAIRAPWSHLQSAISLSHRGLPLDKTLIRSGRRTKRLRRRDFVPAQATVNAVGNHADAVRRTLDAHLDEALKERRDVVVERCREPFGRERPCAKPLGPPPRRALPPRRPGG